MKARVIGLFLLMMVPVLAAALTPPAGTWQSLESYAGPMRSNWVFQPTTRTFQASWSNGNSAVLKLDAFDEQHIVVSRVDSTGPTAGLRVRYEGVRTAAGYSGQVTWCWLDQARRGNWTLQLPPEPQP